MTLAYPQALEKSVSKIISSVGQHTHRLENPGRYDATFNFIEEWHRRWTRATFPAQCGPEKALTALNYEREYWNDLMSEEEGGAIGEARRLERQEGVGVGYMDLAHRLLTAQYSTQYTMRDSHGDEYTADVEGGGKYLFPRKTITTLDALIEWVQEYARQAHVALDEIEALI